MQAKSVSKPKRDPVAAIRRGDPRYVIPQGGRLPKYGYHVLGWSGVLFTKEGVQYLLSADLNEKAWSFDAFREFRWRKVLLWDVEDR